MFVIVIALDSVCTGGLAAESDEDGETGLVADELDGES